MIQLLVYHLGISSFSYILVCIFASYLRNITIRPHLIKDWFYFLFVISLINSINYSILFFFFSFELDIMFYIVNNFFTFLFYIFLSLFLNYYLKVLMINQSDNVTKLNSINRRMFILAAAKVIILGGIVSRLFFLQVKENKKYLTLSDKNRIREWKLPPVRGEFQDYFGNTIAGNFEAYQLHLIPEQVENFRYTINRIKNILELSEKQFQKIIKKKKEIKPWETLIVADNLSWENFSKINNHLYDLNGVKPIISISRNYPYKENYTHILGYVSQANENDILSNENY